MWFQRKFKINNKKIFFLHIPKCGGTSIVNAISNSLEKNRLGLIKGKGNNPVFFVNPRTSRRCAKLLGDDPLEYRKRILAYNMSINHCKFIYGHFSYSEKIFQEFGKEWNFITILRNPVSQWFSYYFYETRENADRRITSDLKSNLL